MTPLASAARAVNTARARLDDAERLLHTVLATDPEPGRAVCGKPSGYQRHHLAGEDPCAACKAAHRWAQAAAGACVVSEDFDAMHDRLLNLADDLTRLADLFHQQNRDGSEYLYGRALSYELAAARIRRVVDR